MVNARKKSTSVPHTQASTSKNPTPKTQKPSGALQKQQHTGPRIYKGSKRLGIMYRAGLLRGGAERSVMINIIANRFLTDLTTKAYAARGTRRTISRDDVCQAIGEMGFQAMCSHTAR